MVAPLEVDLGVLGWADSLILMVLALVVFGPRRLPQIGRQIGKLMYEFRKASNDFKFQMEEELRASEEADRRKKEEERRAALALQAPVPPAPVESVSSNSPHNEGAIYSSDASASMTSTDTQPVPEDSESSPRIQPPTTGEQVAASRPGAAANGIDALSELAEKNGMHHETVSTEASAEAAEPGHPIVEQESHHG